MKACCVMHERHGGYYRGCVHCRLADTTRQLLELDEWVSRMPDAGLDESDPRWAWWHQRPRLER